MFDTIWRNVGLAAIQNPHIYGYSIFAYNGQLGVDGGAGTQDYKCSPGNGGIVVEN